MVGGLGPDGRPDFRSHVVDSLLQSYIDNMHNLHPFLNRSKLQKMVREFKEQYSPDARAMLAASPAAHQLNPGMKRKRSTSAYGEPYSPRGAIERSLRNAIILLVLALGKVCSYKDNLPDPQGDKGPHTNGAWGSLVASTATFPTIVDPGTLKLCREWLTSHMPRISSGTNMEGIRLHMRKQ
jgi:hypothetical protein